MQAALPATWPLKSSANKCTPSKSISMRLASSPTSWCWARYSSTYAEAIFRQQPDLDKRRSPIQAACHKEDLNTSGLEHLVCWFCKQIDHACPRSQAGFQKRNKIDKSPPMAVQLPLAGPLVKEDKIPLPLKGTHILDNIALRWGIRGDDAVQIIAEGVDEDGCLCSVLLSIFLKMIIYRVVYSNYIFCFEKKNHEEISIHQTQPVHHPATPQTIPPGNPPPQNDQVPQPRERISCHDPLTPATATPQHPPLPARAEPGPQPVHISQ